MTIGVYFFIACVVAYVIVLNIWYYEQRSGMSAAERKAEDEKLHEIDCR